MFDRHLKPPQPLCSRCAGPVVAATRPHAPGLHWVCDRCAAQPTLDAASLSMAYRAVADFTQQHLGLSMHPWLPLNRVTLVNASEWASPSEANKLGEARTRVRQRAGAGNASPVMELVNAEVRLVRGLPYLQAAEVLAHEVFHVYSAHKGLGWTPAWEEGTANLWGYLFLAVHPGSLLGESIREGLLQSPDTIYGDGFRCARHAYKQSRGFADYVQRVHSVACASNASA